MTYACRVIDARKCTMFEPLSSVCDSSTSLQPGRALRVGLRAQPPYTTPLSPLGPRPLGCIALLLRGDHSRLPPHTVCDAPSFKETERRRVRTLHRSMLFVDMSTCGP